MAVEGTEGSFLYWLMEYGQWKKCFQQYFYGAVKVEGREKEKVQSLSVVFESLTPL